MPQEENSVKHDYERDHSDVSHMSERISASTSGDSESSERKASAVEIVTFQDPLKKNKLKRAAEPETKVSQNLCAQNRSYLKKK